MGNLLLESFVFEPLHEKHFPLLQRWHSAIHVRELWGEISSSEMIAERYCAKITSDWQQAFIVSRAGTEFGYVQCYRACRVGNGWWPDEPETTCGIDLFIGETHFLGRGYGSEMARAFSDWILSDQSVHRVIADPQPHNVRAVRCYQSAGFRQCDVIDTPDGRAVLMEKLGHA